MKETIVLAFLTIVMISITAFEFRVPEIEPEEKIGVRVLGALQQSSPDEFSALFPTLADFHLLMMKNSELYGKNLADAAREFEKEYDHELFPSFSSSFEKIVEEGNRLGIDWKTAKFVSADVQEKPANGFAVVPLSITFESAGKTHHLKIAKALIIDGKWKISQYITLD